ncbi:hypothetical protein V8E53_011683 [Lactarius tabidus]
MRLGKARVERMRPVRVNKLGKGVRTRDQGVKGERCNWFWSICTTISPKDQTGLVIDRGNPRVKHLLPLCYPPKTLTSTCQLNGVQQPPPSIAHWHTGLGSIWFEPELDPFEPEPSDEDDENDGDDEAWHKQKKKHWSGTESGGSRSYGKSPSVGIDLLLSIWGAKRIRRLPKETEDIHKCMAFSRQLNYAYHEATLISPYALFYHGAWREGDRQVAHVHSTSS